MIFNNVSVCGQSLPDLDNPAVVSDVAIGKEYIDGNGEKQTGTNTYSMPGKGMVFSEYDAEGYPHKIAFVGFNGVYPANYLQSLNFRSFAKEIQTLELSDAVIIGNEFARSCTFIKNLIIGDKIEVLGDWAFDGCEYMTTVTFNGYVPDIPNRFFYNCTRANTYDFSNATTVPSLYSTSSFAHANGCVIKVPASLLSEWQNATNWSALTDVLWEGV